MAHTSENPPVEQPSPVVVQSPPVVQNDQIDDKAASSAKRKKTVDTVTTVILVVLILVIVLATYTNLFSGIGLGGSSKVTFTSNFEETYSGGGPFVIEASGNVWTVQSGGYEIQMFGNTVPFAVAGTFSSSPSVTAFIVSQSVWNSVNVTDHGNVAISDLSPYELNTGSVTSGSLNVDLSAGNYYLVIFG